MARGNMEFVGDRNSSSREQFMVDENGSRKSRSGCFVSMPVGIVLLLVVAAVVAGVGVAVYFLAPSSKSEAQQWIDCQSMATKRQECACPAGWDTSTAAATTTASATTGSPTPSGPPVRPSGMRLNRTFTPNHYIIELQPRFYAGDDFGFNGSVVVDMTCHEPSDLIVMHIHQLTVHEESMQLTQIDGNGTVVRTLSVLNWEEDVSRHFLKIWANETLVQNSTYRLSMSFNGTHLHPDWAGFYLSSYLEEGETKYLVTTQFQRTDARRAFPCFDEPSFKATFDVTLVRKTAYSSISNMPLKAQLPRYLVSTYMAPNYARKAFPCFDEPSFKAFFDIILVRKEDYSTISNMPLKLTQPREDGWVADVYQTSVKMSTYLLAFIVSEFQYKESVTTRGTYMRLWARPKFIKYLDFALNVSGPTLEAYIDYTGIDYPINKTDQIAIPDFAAGAMENWGLVTYRETALLVNEDYSATSDKRYVASVISHELAHQWWGNLVTCEWWDETWLNEGFANNYADVMAAVVLPTWKFNEYFVRTIWSALEVDGVATSQPVFVAGIEHHDDLYRGFNRITYRKGGSVIRMMKYFLSEGTFQKGISTYLNRHSYGNTRREDLYRALEDQAYLDGTASWDPSHANFSDIMDTWIAQMGYPMVHVTDAMDGTLRVEQSHFLYDDNTPVPPSPVGENGEYLWHIPLTYATEDQLNAGNSTKTWIYRQPSAVVTNVPVSGWKLANIFLQGFFRVRYDNATWDSILGQLATNHLVFPVENRGQILDDAFSLASAGKLDELAALKATEYLVKETEYIPLYAGLRTRLAVIGGLLYHTPAQEQMNTYVYNLVRDKYNDALWEANNNPSEHLEKYVRAIIIAENCGRRHKSCLDKAADLYANFMANADSNPIHPDFRSIAYCAAIGLGGAAEFEHAQKRLEAMEATIRDQQFVGYEQNSLKAGMACVKQPWLIKRYLDYAVSRNETSMITAIAQKWDAQSEVWDYLEENWSRLPSSIKKGDVLGAITAFWSSKYHMEKVQRLGSAQSNDGGIFQKALDKIKENADWLNVNEQPINAWLTAVNTGQPRPTSYRYIPEATAHVPARSRRSVVTSLEESFETPVLDIERVI